MTTEPHIFNPSSCGDFHCAIHNVDELGVGFACCFECNHMFFTEDDLLDADFEMQQAYREFTHREPQRMKAGADVKQCPYCTHTF